MGKSGESDSSLPTMVTTRLALYESTVVVPAHVLVREVADELVILSLESEEYFGLDQVGCRIWKLLQAGVTVQQAFELLLAEYDVQPDTLGHDLEALLDELSARKLIELASPADTSAYPRPR